MLFRSQGLPGGAGDGGGGSGAERDPEMAVDGANRVPGLGDEIPIADA